MNNLSKFESVEIINAESILGGSKKFDDGASKKFDNGASKKYDNGASLKFDSTNG